MPATQPDSEFQPAGRRPVPGLLVVFSQSKPRYHPRVLKRSEPLTLGREDVGGLTLGDEKMSTRHVEILWDEGFSVRDLGSRNGTWVDGVRLEGKTRVSGRGVLRLGQTLVLLLPDLSPFVTGEISTAKGMIIGPQLQRVLGKVALARREGRHLLVRGESGAGKELVARTFHEAATRPGPLVSFNCANLQPELAEARLFGTVKGAFTEAKDTSGLFLQADGGVLFLDEVAELAPQVQAKVLRTVETGEVQRVGENSVKKVDVAVVAASHQSLRERVKDGLFRQDLLFRLNQFEVEVPPLRERLEEVPWLMQQAVEGLNVPLHASLVEAALLRPWPGNIRELRSATMAAATDARVEGGPVKVAHLAEQAGRLDVAAPVQPAAQTQAAKVRPEDLDQATVEAALEACNGNATLAAQKLGLHRTQLNRLRQKFGLMD